LAVAKDEKLRPKDESAGPGPVLTSSDKTTPVRIWEVGQVLGTLFAFNGRLSRAGYIEALLAIVLIDLGAGVLAAYARTYGLPIEGYGPRNPVYATVAAYQPLVFGILTAWALLGTSIKRCHDRGKSGWWLLLGLVIVFGWLWLVIDLVLLGGTGGTNKYGRQPHSHEPVRAWSPEPLAATPAVAGQDAPVALSLEAQDHAAAPGDEGAEVHDDAHVQEHASHSHEDVHQHDAHGDEQSHAEAPEQHEATHADAHGHEDHQVGEDGHHGHGAAEDHASEPHGDGPDDHQAHGAPAHA
jgi:uncharacterized membrane protein YhaH (DUF805 family)